MKKSPFALAFAAAAVLVAVASSPSHAQVTKPGGGFVPPGKLGGGGGAGTITSVNGTSGGGLTGGGSSGAVTLGLLTSCSANQVLKWSGSAWACASDVDSGGDITAVNVATGGGLTGGGASGSVTVGLLTSCSTNQVLKWDGAAWACAADADSGGDITAVIVATNGGLTGGATSGPATVGLLTSCSDQQILKWTSGTSSWGCASDADSGGDITAVTTSGTSGLSGGCSSGPCAVTLLTSCSNNQILKWSSGGSTWACAADSDSGGDITGVTTAATSGLTGGCTTGTCAVSLLTSCSDGQILKWNNGTTTWACGADADSGGDITAVNVAGGGGLAGGGTSGSVTVGMRTDCAAGQYLAYTAGSWTCTTAGTSDNAFYGFGIDGALAFDGSSAVLGLSPSSSVYTLNRDIFATTISISTGVTVKTAGYRIFASTSLTFSSATSKITDNGTAGTGVGHGAGSAVAGGGGTGASEVTIGAGGGDGGGGDNGAGGGSPGVGGDDPQGWTGIGGGGGNGAAGGFSGGGGGSATAPGINGGGWGLTELLEFRLLISGHRMLCGTGGGGGGAGNDDGKGGDGGGGGGCVFVATPSISGAGVIEAKGGAGHAGTGSTSGGGGGGGGGGGLIVVVSSTINAPTYTTDVSGGAAGAAGTGGSPTAGAVGGAGKVVTMDPGSPGNGGPGTGFVTSITAGTGLSGGTITGSGTIAVSIAGASCAATEVMTAIGATGTGTCTTATSVSGVGDITSVVAGTGLSGGATSGAATLNVSLTTTTCSAGQAETATAANGTSTCSTFVDTAGTALSLSGHTLNLNITPTTCSAGQAETATSAAGVGTCATFVDTAGTGLSLSGHTLSVNVAGGTCSTGQVVTSVSSTGVVTCGSAIPNDPLGTHFEYVDDWLQPNCSTTNNATTPCGTVWMTNNSGTLSQQVPLASTTRPGLLQWDAGTATTGQAELQTSPSFLDFGSITTAELDWVGGFETLSTSSQEYTAFIGFGDNNATVNQTDGCGFYYDRGNVIAGGANSGNTHALSCMCTAASTRTIYLINGSGNSDESFALGTVTVAAYTAPSTNILSLKVKITTTSGTPTRAEFYSSGTKVCDISTHLPSGSSQVTGAMIRLLKSSGASHTTMDVDYTRLKFDLATARADL